MAPPYSASAISAHVTMPVMEGKALLFKHFAGVDAVPITSGVGVEKVIFAPFT